MEQQTNNTQQLAEAYAAAWAEVQNVAKNATNPHFKSDYATLDAVIDTVKPIFAKYGLAVFQSPGKMVDLGDTIGIAVVNSLIHKSGAMMTFETQIPLGKNATAQAAGGAITYARRYALAAIAGIAQVDDDGNAASAEDEDDGVDTDNLRALIEDAGDEAELENLKEEVQATGDKSLVDLFVKRRKQLKKAAKKGDA